MATIIILKLSSIVKKMLMDSLQITLTISTLAFAIISEEHINKITHSAICVELARCLFFFIAYMFVFLGCVLWNKRKTIMKGREYSIAVEYGNLFEKDGFKVIPFDECFTTIIGTKTGDIKKGSVCGQYLEKYPIDNMQNLIEEAGLIYGKRKVGCGRFWMISLAGCPASACKEKHLHFHPPRLAGYLGTETEIL